MLYYLIMCRSLTSAQRTAVVLERVGIPARTIRSPKHLSSDGCGYSVKIKKEDLDACLELLNRAGLGPKRVFAAMRDGSYTEIAL